MSQSEALIPFIQNVTCTPADTEVTATLPVGTKYFSIQARTSAAVRFAFETGKVAGPTAPYATVKADSVYNAPEKLGWSFTSATDNVPKIYLASSVDTTVVEIVGWKDKR